MSGSDRVCRNSCARRAGLRVQVRSSATRWEEGGACGAGLTKWVAGGATVDIVTSHSCLFSGIRTRGWFLSCYRREIHRHHTTTRQCAATCNRQSDHPYTQASSGSSNVPETDRSIEEKVMARKKDKKAQKDKKALKDKTTATKQSAQGAPTTAATTVAPSASPRPKKS